MCEGYSITINSQTLKGYFPLIVERLPESPAGCFPCHHLHSDLIQCPTIIPGLPVAESETSASEPAKPGGKEAAEAFDRHLPVQTQHQVLPQPGDWKMEEKTFIFHFRCQFRMPPQKTGRSTQCQYTSVKLKHPTSLSLFIILYSQLRNSHLATFYAP